MLIARHIHSGWLLIRRHKDIAEISRQTGIGRVKISHALNHAWADEKTFKAVSDFYKSRSAILNEIETFNSEY